MNNVTFNKAATGYLVSIEGKTVGSVVRTEEWTTRGNRVIWKAYRKGTNVGNGSNRKEAAAFLSA